MQAFSDESYHKLIVAVITGNATPDETYDFEQLMKNNDSFRYLFKQLFPLFKKNPSCKKIFDPSSALEKLKQRLGM